jgi:hypothetical protein
MKVAKNTHRILKAQYRDYNGVRLSMATVINPALSMAASGNLGGVCYSRWRGLAVARSAWVGTVPNTPAQVTSQGLLRIVSQAWSYGMSVGERDQWRQYGASHPVISKLGVVYAPSGYQVFMRLNLQRLQCGGAIAYSPPITSNSFCGTLMNVVAHYGLGWMDIWLNYETAGGPPYWYEYFRAGPYVSQGRRPIAGEWRKVYCNHGTQHYYDTSCVHNQFYWYRGRGVLYTGLVGNWFEGQAKYA